MSEAKKYIKQLLEEEMESIPATLHDLIPDGTEEQKLLWITRAKRLGLLPGYNPWLAHSLTQTAESEILSGSNAASPDKVVEALLKAEIESIAEDVRDLIPDNMSNEQKLRWIRTATKKGLLKKASPYPSVYSSSKGIGTAPYTGPGTAPGTGPGTAPWLEQGNMTMPPMRYVQQAPKKDEMDKELLSKMEKEEDL